MSQPYDDQPQAVHDAEHGHDDPALQHDPTENIIGGPDCTICHWEENAPPAFTDEMREIMEDIFQKGEIIRQRSARNRGVTTFVRKHSSLLPKQGSQTEPKSA